MIKKILLTILLFPTLSQAAIKTLNVEYSQGGQILEGVLTYDEDLTGKRPGVVIVPDWLGIGENSKMRAVQMAQMGYVAFIADIYGKGIRPKNPTEARTQTGRFKNDRPLLRARAKAAYDALAAIPKVDSKKILAIGYCFGGSTVLEMARDGLPLAGVVSFHGGLDTPNAQDAKNIKAKLLIAHGAIDPHVSAAEVTAFQKEMNEAKVDYQFIAYSGAVHAFTIKTAGNDPKTGAAYHEKADQRSFEAMKAFFAEVLQ
jgi:dienelactone hydrolase